MVRILDVGRDVKGEGFLGGRGGVQGVPRLDVLSSDALGFGHSPMIQERQDR